MEFGLAERINWAEHLAEYAKLLDTEQISVQAYCEKKGIPFGSAKRHISTKKAREFLSNGAKKGNSQKKTNSKAKKNRSTTIVKKAPKKTGARANNSNAKKTGVITPIENIPAPIVKRAVINMDRDTSDSAVPLERVLTVLYAQLEFVLQNQSNMHSAIDHLYESEEIPDKTEWNEGESHVLKRYRCDAAITPSLTGLAETISQVQKRQVEIEVKRRELSNYTRLEELQIINNAYEERFRDNLNATDTVRLIEAFGVEPPISLTKEMEKEITFLEPPEETPEEGMTDEEFSLEVIEFEKSLGAELAKITSLESAFNGGISVGHDNGDEELSEKDFE